ncbi:MAG: hypothetical protein ACRENN_08365, partial [Candidatus Eiseniibacteriota bacterium]
IMVAIVRIMTQGRLEELSRRERIAAIERGVDPEKLPPLPPPVGESSYLFGHSRLRRAHGLMIGGMILVACGIGLAILAYSVEPDKSHWTVGLIPLLVGFALLGSSAIVWPRGGDQK